MRAAVSVAVSNSLARYCKIPLREWPCFVALSLFLFHLTLTSPYRRSGHLMYLATCSVLLSYIDDLRSV